MKITLNQDPAFPETEIIINCPQADEDILRLVAMLRIHQHKLVGNVCFPCQGGDQTKPFTEKRQNQDGGQHPAEIFAGVAQYGTCGPKHKNFLLQAWVTASFCSRCMATRIKGRLNTPSTTL